MKILNSFRNISKYTALFFSVYFTLFSSISYAQYSETAKPAQDYFQIAIPQELGTISNSYFTSVAKSDLGKDAKPSSGMIIHIQDAHGQLSAQKNIQQILELLVSKYGFKTVFLEGGLNGKISPDLLRFFKDEAANEKVANQLLEDGHIEGADVFLLKSKGKVSAYGLESEKLYRKNILAFREVISQKKDADVFLAELKKQITSFGSHYFNPDLNKFSKEWLDFQDNRTETLQHLEILDLYASKYLKINLHEAKKQFDYPQLVRIFSIKKMEKDYGGESVRPQLQKDLKRLKKWMLEKKINPAYAQIFEALVNYSYSSLNPSIPVDVRSFLENFYAVAKPKGFSFSNYYVFMKYLGLLLLAQELEPERLFDEIKKMNVEILKSLANTPEENSLVRLIRDYYLAKKLFSLELTRDEYAEIVEKEKIISPVVLTSRLRMLENTKIKVTEKTPAELTDLFHSAIRFYDLAQQREDKMFNSMLSVLEGKQEKKIILVTGGFHSRGLETLMRGQNFSFIEVTPKMSEIQSNEKYIEQMLAGTSTVHAIDPAKISLFKIRGFMGEEEYRFQEQVIEKAKAESLGATTKLEEAGIFSGLESELENLAAEFYVPGNPTSDEQEGFAKAALPIVERWIRDHQSDIRENLFSAVSRPKEKEEQYHRNQAVVSPNFEIFTHVWRPGGETRIHDHGGALGITAPLTDGMEEDQFNFAQDSDFGSSNGAVVEMSGPKKIVLQKGNASVITKGTGAIHRIRNTSSDYGIMLEIYFWLGKSPVESVNTFVPVEGSAAQYLVRHEHVDEITVSLVDKLLKGAGEAVTWEILRRLKAAKSDPKKLSLLLPMFTTKGTVIVDLEKAINIVGASIFSMPKIMVEPKKPYTYVLVSDPNVRSQHGASLGEKADPAQVRSLLFQHINGLMTHPTIQVLADRGVFKLFGDVNHPKEVKLLEIANKFNVDDPYQNLGNIYGGMRTLALQGYLKIKDVDEKTSYELTEEGWAAVQQAESGYFSEVVEAIGNLKNYHKFFRGPPNTESKSALKQIQHLITLSKKQPQINDVLTCPVMVALGMPLFEKREDDSIKEKEPDFFKFFDKETQTLNLDSLKIQHDRKFLDASFELLFSQGLVEFVDEARRIVRLTPMGIGLKNMVVSFGVTNAYLNLYEELEDAFFGNPDPADIANDGHIDRVMDIWGSSGSHKPYLKNGKGEGILAMVKKIFDGPLDQQPEGVADMGCGDGGMLAEIVEHIIHHTERGKHLADFPLAVVAADYSPKSQGRAAATLEKFVSVKGVHVEVMFGDVTRPDNYDAEIQKRFAAKGMQIGAKDLLHTQMFLPHERHLQVKTREEAHRIIREHLKTVNQEALKKLLNVKSLPSSEDELLELVEKQFTVSYSDKGRLTPGIVAAADLIQFVSRWTQYTPKGLIILDLHTARPEELGENKQAFPAYWGTHWISQHIMPYQEHNLCLLLAGLEPQETIFYPSKAPYSVSLSNYLPSQIAKAASLGISDNRRHFRLSDEPFMSGKREKKVDKFVRDFKSDLIQFEFELRFYEELDEIEPLAYEDYLEIKEANPKPVSLEEIGEKIAELDKRNQTDLQPQTVQRLKDITSRFKRINSNQQLKTRLERFARIDEQLGLITKEKSMEILAYIRDHYRKGEILRHSEMALLLSKDGEKRIKIPSISDWIGGRKRVPQKYLFRANNLYEGLRKPSGPAVAGLSLGGRVNGEGNRPIDRFDHAAAMEGKVSKRRTNKRDQKDDPFKKAAGEMHYLGMVIDFYEALLAEDYKTEDGRLRRGIFIDLAKERVINLINVTELKHRLDSFYSSADVVFAEQLKKITSGRLHELKTQFQLSVDRELSGQLREDIAQAISDITRGKELSDIRQKLKLKGDMGRKLLGKYLSPQDPISPRSIEKYENGEVRFSNGVMETAKKLLKDNESGKTVLELPAKKEKKKTEPDPQPGPQTPIAEPLTDFMPPLPGASLGKKLAQKLYDEKVQLEKSRGKRSVSAASSLGSSNLAIAYEVAGAVDFGIVRFENPFEARAFAEMASAEEAAKSAQFASSEAVKAFNRDLSRFIKQLGPGDRVRSGESSKRQNPFILIAFDNAFGSDQKIDNAAIAARLAKSLHTGDSVVGVWGGKIKPEFLHLLNDLAQNQITVHDVPTPLATDAIIQSLIVTREVSPVSVSSMPETQDLELTLNGTVRVKFNLDVFKQKGIEPAQVVALIREIGSNTALRGRFFSDYGFNFHEKENGKGFWVVGAAFAKKLEEIYAKSLGDKAIARAA